MKKVLVLIVSLFTICTLFGVISFNRVIQNAKEEAEQLENVLLEVGQVTDGIYQGHSEIGPVIVDVEVTVKGGMIEKIDIIQHQNGMGQSAERIIDDMIDSNTYNVDAVTGATISSKVIIHAVNDALKKGL